MQHKEAKELLDKYLAGTCTPAEKMLVERAYNLTIKPGQQEIPTDRYAQMKDSMWDVISQLSAPERKVVRIWPRVAVAASILFCLVTGSYFYQKYTGPSQVITGLTEVTPGGNKAVLTLADGKKVSLTDALNGEVSRQSGATITKTANGELVYTAAGQSNGTTRVEYNTVETPNGGQFLVQLPDGSKVWLNAASSLKFPADFGGLDRRVVELTGEAYFEIAKDKSRPFIVKTDSQQVQVLGTHFNVNAYHDEPDVKTTLLEGAVKVAAINGQAIVLKPGEQAVWQAKQLNVQVADLDEAIAWKNGYFRFNDEKLQSVMRKLSRWYDVEVKYVGNPSMEEFTGKISRNKNISQVLKVLESTKAVHFKLEGRRITVQP
jgi:transmembrane sensor